MLNKQEEHHTYIGLMGYGVFHANSKSTSAKKLQKKPGIIYNGEHKHETKLCHRKKCILRGGSYKC